MPVQPSPSPRPLPALSPTPQHPPENTDTPTRLFRPYKIVPAVHFVDTGFTKITYIPDNKNHTSTVGPSLTSSSRHFSTLLQPAWFLLYQPSTSSIMERTDGIFLHFGGRCLLPNVGRSPFFGHLPFHHFRQVVHKLQHDQPAVIVLSLLSKGPWCSALISLAARPPPLPLLQPHHSLFPLPH